MYFSWQETECLNNSYEDKIFLERNVLQGFESEDKNIENENDNCVNEDDFLELSI